MCHVKIIINMQILASSLQYSTTEAPQLKHATVYHGIFNFVKHNRTFKT